MPYIPWYIVPGTAVVCCVALPVNASVAPRIRPCFIFNTDLTRRAGGYRVSDASGVSSQHQIRRGNIVLHARIEEGWFYTSLSRKMVATEDGNQLFFGVQLVVDSFVPIGLI